MTTLLAREIMVVEVGGHDEKKTAIESVVSLKAIPALGAQGGEKRFWFQRGKSFDADAIATQPSVFDDPDTAEQYHPKREWENYHRFDPLFRWSWREEYRVVAKIDRYIMVWACVMFIALELDRANLTRALTDNFLEDLGLGTNDYNYANTVFKVAFMCAEIPSQLLCKWIGPDRWVPGQMVLWSVAATAQFWLNGRLSLLFCRGLLGVLQAGFIPQIILYLSYFYKHHELSLRLGFFYTSMSMADVASSLIAYGILHMRGVLGLPGWRWLFLIEGLGTLLLGVLAFLLMPPGPCHTAGWLRGRKGWFTEHQEKIIVNRLIREDPSKSSMHSREPLTLALFWESLCDYDMWPVYVLGMCFWIPMSPPLQYLTLSLRNLGFDTFQSNLLTIPYTFLHMATMLAITYAAEIRGELTLTSLAGQFWALPFLIYFNVVDLTRVGRWTLWVVTTLLIGFPSATPIQQGWSSRNSNTVRARTVSAACYNAFVQAGGIISTNIYRADDAPLYRRGNSQLLAILCMNICLYLLTKAYYVARNRHKDRLWCAMSEDQRLDYLATTADEGNKRLDFRFQH